MSDPRDLAPADVRKLLRLNHQVHTSSDPVERKRQLLAGLCDLTGADGGVSVVARVDDDDRRHVTISSVSYGQSPEDEDALVSRFRDLPSQKSDEHASGGAWHHLSAAKPTRLYHCLKCPIPALEARLLACLLLSRRRGRPAFRARDQLLLHVAHLEMNWVYHGDLLLASPAARKLTPRERETLQYLLAGFGEKEIASKMILSHNTIHHYVKAIHKKFRVSSRSELLALWLR